MPNVRTCNFDATCIDYLEKSFSVHEVFSDIGQCSFISLAKSLTKKGSESGDFESAFNCIQLISAGKCMFQLYITFIYRYVHVSTVYDLYLISPVNAGFNYI